MLGANINAPMQRLRAQRKNEEATTIEKRFLRAWTQADVKPAASRFQRVFPGHQRRRDQDRSHEPIATPLEGEGWNR